MAVNAASAFQPLAADSPRRGLAPRSPRQIRAVLHRRRQTAWRARPRALSARIVRPVGVSWPRARRQVGNRDTRSCSATDPRAGLPVRPSRTSLTTRLSGGQPGDPPIPECPDSQLATSWSRRTDVAILSGTPLCRWPRLPERKLASAQAPPPDQSQAHAAPAGRRRDSRPPGGAAGAARRA